MMLIQSLLTGFLFATLIHAEGDPLKIMCKDEQNPTRHLMVELDLRNNNARLEYQRGNGEKPLNLDVKNSDHERIITSTQILTMSMRTPGRKTISICASREENFMACHHEKFTLILSDIDGILSTAKLSYISGVPDFYPLVVVDFSAEPMICTFVNQ